MMSTPSLDTTKETFDGKVFFTPTPSTLEIDNGRLSQGEDDDEETETMPDDQEILLPNMVLRVWRKLGFWMFKVQYEDSTLDPQFFSQLSIGGLPASNFAESVTQTSDNQLHVKWGSHWRDHVPGNLELDLDRFEALVSPGDQLLWIGQSSLCNINDGQRIHHLCFDPDCKICASLSNQVKLKKAVEFITLVLEGCPGVDLDGVSATAKEVLELAHYNNPVSQYFITANATLVE